MQIVILKKPAQFHIGYWKYHHNLPAGREYIFFDSIIKKMDKVKDLFINRELNDIIPLYQGEDLSGKSLLFISLGGYGDALCFVQALNTLQKRFPDARIDTSINMDMYMLIKQFNFKGGWLNYPIPMEYFRKYDFYQTSESLEKKPNMDAANIARKYSELFHVPVDLSNSLYTPYGTNKIVEVEKSSKKRIAIQVDSATGANRSYPRELVLELALLLAEEGYNVFLFGFLNPKPEYKHENIVNLINRLSSVCDAVALLSQMDLIIAPDSVGGHIGGMLNIPTIVLYSVTNIGKMEHYPSVIPMPSGLSCAPCLKLYECPLGYEKCEAFDDPSVSPLKIFERVKGVLF